MREAGCAKGTRKRVLLCSRSWFKLYSTSYIIKYEIMDLLNVRPFRAFYSQDQNDTV